MFKAGFQRSRNSLTASFTVSREIQAHHHSQSSGQGHMAVVLPVQEILNRVILTSKWEEFQPAAKSTRLLCMYVPSPQHCSLQTAASTSRNLTRIRYLTTIVFFSASRPILQIAMPNKSSNSSYYGPTHLGRPECPTYVIPRLPVSLVFENLREAGHTITLFFAVLTIRTCWVLPKKPPVFSLDEKNNLPSTTHANDSSV